MELSFSRDALGIVIDGVITGPRGMKRVKFLLDTGASECFVHRSILIGAGYPVGEGKHGTKLQTAGGIVQSEDFSVESLRVYENEVKDLRVSCFNIPEESRIEGLLGLNFLKHFRLTLDFPNGKLIME